MRISIIKGMYKSMITNCTGFEKVCKQVGHTPKYDDMLDMLTLEISNELVYDFLYRLNCEFGEITII